MLECKFGARGGGGGGLCVVVVLGHLLNIDLTGVLNSLRRRKTGVCGSLILAL